LYSNSSTSCLAVTSSSGDVSDSVGSLGEGSLEVLLGVGVDADEGSEVRSEGGLDLSGELAVVLLVEDERIISLIDSVTFAWGEVEGFELAEELVGPGLDSANVLVGSGGVVVHEVDEGGGVALDLVQSLGWVGGSASEGGGEHAGVEELHF
jgi:hypothetical protein